MNDYKQSETISEFLFGKNKNKVLMYLEKLLNSLNNEQNINNINEEKYQLLFLLLCSLDINENKSFAKDVILNIRKNKKIKEYLLNKILKENEKNDENAIEYLLLKTDVFSKKYFTFNFEND